MDYKNKSMKTIIDKSVDKKRSIQIAINSLTDMRDWSDRLGSDELSEIGFVINLLKETIKINKT